MMESKVKSMRAVIVVGILSVLLLSLFFYLQSEQRDLLDLPVQYLVVAAIPLMVALLISGYISEIKAGKDGLSISLEKILNKSVRVDDPVAGTAAPKSVVGFAGQSWQLERQKEYDRTDHYMLVHVYKPSSLPGQKYDISIFVARHKRGTATPPQSNFDEIESAEFFFGESWGNKVFQVDGENGFFGIRTHAWGTFLAMCRITFKDKQRDPINLYRYVDFFMA